MLLKVRILEMLYNSNKQKMKKKLCLVFNIPAYYNEPTYLKLEEEYDCEWFFGDWNTDIKKMDVGQFKHCHFLRVNHQSSHLFSQNGMISILCNKEHHTFLMSGETRNLSFWWFLFVRNMFFPKKKIFLWTHGWYGKETRLESIIKKWIYRSVSGIFTYGDYAKSLLIKEGLSEDKIFHIHNALHYDQQIEIRNVIKPSMVFREYFGNTFPVVIFIGRLTPVKKLDQLVDAISSLKTKGENYNLVFVGDGSEKDILAHRVEKLGLANQVWFYGACYDEKINAELIYNADICVAPGNIGLTAMHSLVYGTPAISHDNFAYQMPEFESIIPGKTGYFFKQGDVQSLADTIQRWFDTHDDRDAIRQACFKEIDENWTPEYQFRVISNVINKV